MRTVELSVYETKKIFKKIQKAEHIVLYDYIGQNYLWIKTGY